MTPKLRGILSVGVLILTLAILAWGLREVFTREVPGGNDLYPRWAAGCAWLSQGIDPYSQEATLSVQQGIYGRPALPSEDQVAFAYPIFVMAAVWPLCLTPDFATAHAATMAALMAGVIGSAILARRVSGWKVGGWLWPWILFWIVISYPSARSILLGQLAVLVGLLQLGSLEALRGRKELLAGALLAFSTLKPQMGILLVPSLVFWGAATRRWRFLASFAGSLAILLMVPMLWLPSWIPAWLGQLRAYPAYTEFGSATWILTTYYLRTPGIVELILTGGLLAGWALAWWKNRSAPFESTLWLLSLTLVLTHFVSPRTATTHFGPLLLPAFMTFRVFLRASGQTRTWVVGGFVAVVAVLSWTLFLLTVQGRQESAVNYLPIPIGLLVGLFLIRAPWRRLMERGG